VYPPLTMAIVDRFLEREEEGGGGGNYRKFAQTSLLLQSKRYPFLRRSEEGLQAGIQTVAPFAGAVKYASLSPVPRLPLSQCWGRQRMGTHRRRGK